MSSGAVLGKVVPQSLFLRVERLLRASDDLAPKHSNVVDNLKMQHAEALQKLIDDHDLPSCRLLVLLLCYRLALLIHNYFAQFYRSLIRHGQQCAWIIMRTWANGLGTHFQQL